MTPERRRISELDDEVNMGNLETVQRLLQEGADVNGRNVVDETPQMAAAWTGQPDMVRLLLSFEADPSLTDRRGITARQMALEVGHEDVLVVFIDHDKA